MGNDNSKKLPKDLKKLGPNGYSYEDPELQGVVANFMDIGFTEEQIVQAWFRTNKKPDLMLSYLTKNWQRIIYQFYNYHSIINIISQGSLLQKEEDKLIQQAIEMSIKHQNQDCLQDVENHLRTEDPIGLQNLGRTCYFNSFLQTLFHIRELRDPILRLELPDNNKENISDQRQKLNEMLKQFQLTFAAMLKSQKNFTDPSNLFEVLKGLSGQVFRQGEEHDFWEFQNQTLEYLEQAFKKDCEIDTVDLFKSYLRLQSNGSQQMSSLIKKSELKNDNMQLESDQQDVLRSNTIDEEFVIYKGINTFIQQNTQTNQTTRIDQNNNANLSTQMNDEIQEESTLSLIRQDSNKKKQQKKVKNPITELFFGVGEEKISIFSKDVEAPAVKINDIPIGIFNLEAKMGDLYTALNSYFNQSVGDYQPDPIDNLTQSAIIKKQTAPKILNFYINRINYNKDTQTAEKSNKKFTFDKEIYIDNYMKGKDQEFETQKNQIQELDNDLAILEAQLLKFENYNNVEGQNAIPILSAIEQVKSYLSSQLQKADNFIDIEELISDISNDNVNVDVGVIGQKFQVQQNVYLLDSYYQKIKYNKEIIEKKIKELREKKQIIQNQNKTIKYELFSILIHQGYANTGHYYCFIYDDKKLCWYKFNDSVVTKVPEEEVFRLSFGEQDGNCNACCLFYKNSQTKVNPNKPVEISARLKAEVNKKDQSFLDSIDEVRIRRRFQQIEQDFNNFVKDTLNKAYSISQNKNANNIFIPFFQFQSFTLFLLNMKEDKAIGFGKRIILMNILEKQDYTELEQSLTKKDNLYQGITMFYEHMISSQGIQGQILNDQQKLLFKQLESFYITILKFLNFTSNIINDTLNFPQNLKMLGSLRKAIQYYKDSYLAACLPYEMLKFCIKYIHDVLLLKSCFMIDKYLHQGQIPNALTLLNIIILSYLQFHYQEKQDTEKSSPTKKKSDNETFDKNPLVKSNFESPEINTNFSLQIKNNLKQTFSNFGPALDKETKPKFEGQLSLLNSPEKFNNYKQKLISTFEDIDLKLDVNIYANDIVYRVYDQFEIFLKKSQVWVQQLQILRQNKTLITQEIRLNQEEVLYFE